MNWLTWQRLTENNVAYGAALASQLIKVVCKGYVGSRCHPSQDEAIDSEVLHREPLYDEKLEVCLFEAKSKALKFITKEEANGTRSDPYTWQTQGVGKFRVLKNKDTNKCRVLFRAEPTQNIIVNANLLPMMEYASIPQGKSGAVKGPFYNGDKETLERWVFKLKTKEMAAELAGIIKDNQKN